MADLDLSELIQSNDVPIDESYYERCKESNKELYKSISPISSVSLSCKDLKLTFNKNYLVKKKSCDPISTKSSSQNAFSMDSSQPIEKPTRSYHLIDN